MRSDPHRSGVNQTGGSPDDRARIADGQSATALRRQVVAECTQLARDTWQPFVDDVRGMIIEETSEQVALDESLRELVVKLQAAVAEGEGLLFAGRPSVLEAKV